MSIQYSNAHLDVIANGDNNACAVIAVMLATDNSYPVVANLMQDFGRKIGRGTYFDKTTTKVLNALGYHPVKLTAGTHYNAKTVRQLGVELRQGNLPRQVLLVQTAGHIFCARDRQVHDWQRDRKHRIHAIYRLEKIGSLDLEL